MAMTHRGQLKTGDVIEIPTPRGLAYAQYIHEHAQPSQYGSLLRLLPLLYKSRPSDPVELTRQREWILFFFPMGSAIERGVCSIVGNEEIPEALREFPLFRVVGKRDSPGRALSWRLWDGKREWDIGELAREQRGLPVRWVVKDEWLLTRLAGGYAITESLRRRVKIGDVIEIPTPAGLAYAQYIYKYDKPPRYGSLVRVLPGLYETRQFDFAGLARERERFVIFCPVGPSVWRGIFAVAGNEEIPEWARAFPLFRVEGARDNSGRVLNWGLWDGERRGGTKELTPEQRNLPVLSVVTPGLLIKWVAEGWAWADDV